MEEALGSASALGEEGIPYATSIWTRSTPTEVEAARVTEDALRDALAIATDTVRMTSESALPKGLVDPTGGSGFSRGDEPVGSSRELPSGITAFRRNSGSLVALAVRGFMIRFHSTRSEQLPNPGRVTAVEAALGALAKHDRERWSSAVAELLPHLPILSAAVLHVVESQLGSALQRAITLETLAPPLPTWWSYQPSSSREVKENDRFSRAIRVLAPHLACLPRATIRPLWRDMLETFASDDRPSLLADLVDVAPLIQGLGGIDGALESVVAVDFAGLRWP